MPSAIRRRLQLPDQVAVVDSHPPPLERAVDRRRRPTSAASARRRTPTTHGARERHGARRRGDDDFRVGRPVGSAGSGLTCLGAGADRGRRCRRRPSRRRAARRSQPSARRGSRAPTPAPEQAQQPRSSRRSERGRCGVDAVGSEVIPPGLSQRQAEPAPRPSSFVGKTEDRAARSDRRAVVRFEAETCACFIAEHCGN